MSITSMHDGRVVLHQNDCRDVLRGLADNSIDSVVTDPPYALVSIQKRFGKPGSAPAKDVYGRGAAGFMGKQWDTGEVAFSEGFWAAVLRVLKPGGHVVAFSGTRTYHRMAVAIEDAGFEIRDQLGWVYGSGFPKSHNQRGDWEGWGTALKPAWEPIALARKPLTGTVAANLAEWGVGAINVDGCRVETDEALRDGAGKLWSHYREGEASLSRIYADAGGTSFSPLPGVRGGDPRGRWPANIVHDGSEEVLAAFPNAKGQQGYVGPKHGERPSKGIYGDFGARPDSHPRIEEETSAARFFYCAKASRADRDAGLDHLPKKAGGMVSNTSGQHMTRRDEGYKPEPRANTHPTVKPTTLMQWLCRLITPPGGIILDPFMGSGSTGKAAVLEGFQFIGCEREDEYMPIATARIAWAIGVVSKDDELAAEPANDNGPADLFSEAA
ncbi:DNA-methyltransferase [Agrobacterium tumefaciens]|uniref:DNA-methyltransferase n=1 Tax=Agrobacterium tumefaciens TaxID=358 RepID=UPI003BA19E34